MEIQLGKVIFEIHMSVKKRLKTCRECGLEEEVLDGYDLCDNCHGKSDHGPDLTCAMLGRGERVFKPIVGSSNDGSVKGCCRVCHKNYYQGEVQMIDGRWAEVCCTVENSIKENGLLKFTPFKQGAHRSEPL